MKKKIANTWLSWIMLLLMIVILIIPILINFLYVDFDKETYHSNLAWANTIKFTFYRLLILLLSTFIYTPLLFLIPSSISKKLATISLARSLMFTFGVQIAFSSMFYSNGFLTTDFFKNIFNVKNFAGIKRSNIPLYFQLMWTSLPTSLLLLGPSISRYLNNGMHITNKRELMLSIIDYIKTCWLEIILIFLLSMMSGIFFSPIQLFGSEEAAFQYKKDTIGLLIFRSIKKGDFAISSKLTIQLLFIAIPIAILIFWTQTLISHRTKKNVTYRRVGNNKYGNIYTKILSTSLISFSIIFLFLPMFISFLNGFVDIDYNNYLAGQSGWTIENYGSVIKNIQFHTSFWKTFIVTFASAVISFLIISTYINFVKNRSSILNNFVISLLFILLIIPSSSYITGTYKMLVNLKLANSILFFFVIPRILYISRMFVLLNMFDHKNKNAVAIFDKSKINLFKRYMNVILTENNLQIIISIVILTTIGFADSYMFNSMGYVTTGFESVIVFLSTGFINPLGEINRQQQAAALVIVFIENVIILKLSSIILNLGKERIWND